MKRPNIKNILRDALFIALPLTMGGVGMSSCKAYLDKAPNSDIEESTPYKNFRNFQGFVEELYNCIPVVSNNDYHTCFNYGEDDYWEPQETRLFARSVDYGDFWGYTTCYYAYPSTLRGGNGSTSAKSDKANLWKISWYAIRKANIGLEQLNQLVDATDEERKVIEGQLYFFRGFFYYMLMEWWGGMPYMDHSLSPSENPTLPRETWQACAEKVAADLDKAASLLPINWDDEPYGKTTLGNNNMRANKIMALAYKGKVLLWAGSPLMNWESHGRNNAYAVYDKDFCKRGADALGQALALNNTHNRYELAPMDQYNDLCVVFNSKALPGVKEAILQENITEYQGRWAWNMNTDFRPQSHISAGIKCWPTANYSTYFGMANGYPIKDATKKDAESGYDPEYPWANRDPRFYKDFIIDGEWCGTNGQGLEADLATGGKDREGANPQKGCYTGLMNSKLCLKLVHNGNVRDNYACVLSLMRLADVYLLYSEAAAVGYGVKASTSTNAMTAEQAVNVVRDRAGVGHVVDKFTGDTESFLGEVRRERAVELAFEGMRFHDLRRWMLINQRPYTLKTAFQFDRGPGFKPGSTENAVLNLREEVLVERNFTSRHFWLPLPNKDDTYLYEGFEQNPGW
ncbi:MAG: RagB/SusD family nutrient uptake outer membrane protein [Bacteroidaceae bacterium]|nr:RagB/SusD family nutrient uptake outer membrane protein [Bacteroidaceae bacterium]